MTMTKYNGGFTRNPRKFPPLSPIAISYAILKFASEKENTRPCISFKYSSM